PELATCISALEKICANFEKKYKLQDKTTQVLSSRVFTLENHDLYSKIDNYVNETMKEIVQNALQALVRNYFRELSEFEMKEILHDRMFESGSYRSQHEYAALYNALETQNKARRKGMIMMHLVQNSLKLRRPQHERLLTREKLPLAPPSKRLSLNLSSLLMMLQYQMMPIS
nr:hypothetical protein [Tanacetum cinerariifolium]